MLVVSTIIFKGQNSLMLICSVMKELFFQDISHNSRENMASIIPDKRRHSSSSESEMQEESDTDYFPSAQPKHARINNNMPRGQGRGRARGRGQSTPITPSRGGWHKGGGTRGSGTRGRGRGRGTGAIVQQTVISAWTDAGIQPPNNISFSGNPGITQVY